VLCIRWYLRYKLSCHDLVEMMAERGLQIAHPTILRWIRLRQACRGALMKPTSGFAASGLISTG
jgi:hypothetical protein